MFHDFRRHGIENVSLTELGPISKKAEPSRRSPLCDSRRGGIRVNPHALPTHSFSATIQRRDAGNQGKIGSESEQRGDPWRNQYRLDRVSITPRKYNKDASPPPRPCGVGRCPKRRDNGRGPGHPVGLNPLSARRPLPPCRRRNTLRQRQRENRVSEIQPEPANGCLSRRVPRPTSREQRPRFYQLSFARVLSPPPLCGSLTAVTLSRLLRLGRKRTTSKPSYANPRNTYDTQKWRRKRRRRGGGYISVGGGERRLRRPVRRMSRVVDHPDCRCRHRVPVTTILAAILR